KQGTNRRRIMEFNEKLQQLRTRKNLTQEQLAEQLYVSRTAISKWESGKGYPNIESLKCISKFFSVTIDELLSGEELITLAETENRSNLKKIYNYIYGILDMMAVAFIFLPLYGNPVGGYVYAVNLLSFTATTPFHLAVYCSTFAALFVIWIAKIILTHLNYETYGAIDRILDMMAVAFILLPLYGNSVGCYVYADNLLSFTATTPFHLAVYWSAFAALIVIGIAKIILTHLDKETWGGIATKCSLGLTA